VSVAAVAALLTGGGVAHAEDQTAPLTAVARLAPAAATVTAGTLNFGTIGLLTNQVNAAATITVTVNMMTRYVVSINAGSGGGTVVDRTLDNGRGQKVHFQVYTDSSFSWIWGDGTSGTRTNAGVSLGPGTTVISMYGRISPQTTPPPGTYTSALTVTVTF
jgi:spore coat protein U-like protein